jgi:two-component system OmpR family response regulator
VKILVVDDDPRIREVVTIALERAGHAVITATDGQGALRAAHRDGPALMILDVGLPELDGLEVCRRLRRDSDLPILFLTARDDEVDRILGLELGGDDYVTKPFSPRELVARVAAILKRAAPKDHIRRQALQHGALRLDPDRHGCEVAGQAVGLTATEMGLLERLMRHPGHVTSRAQLIEAVWGAASDVSDRTVDSHLRNLRAKLAEAGLPEAVETLHGIGLRMGPCGNG